MLSGDYILVTHPSGDRSLHPQSLDVDGVDEDKLQAWVRWRQGGGELYKGVCREWWSRVVSWVAGWELVIISQSCLPYFRRMPRPREEKNWRNEGKQTARTLVDEKLHQLAL